MPPSGYIGISIAICNLEAYFANEAFNLQVITLAGDFSSISLHWLH